MSAFTFAVPDAFEPAECDAIIFLGDGAPADSAPVWADGEYAVDADSRRVQTALRVRDAETGWLFERLDALFARAGEEFGLAVGRLTEPIQILRYGEGDHFQRWHTDGGLDRQEARLISVSVELSDAGDYEGGLLEIVPDSVGRPRTLPRGGAMFFPSRALHRVAPVVTGVRRSLVAWTGPPPG
jgi:PKHD-type hydroxylase